MLSIVKYSRLVRLNTAARRPRKCVVKRPSLLTMLLVGGLGAGVVQGFMMGLLKSGSFVMMPLTFGSLPFDVLFFTAWGGNAAVDTPHSVSR